MLLRSEVVTARALALPALMLPIMAATLPKTAWTSPAMTAV